MWPFGLASHLLGTFSIDALTLAFSDLLTADTMAKPTQDTDQKGSLTQHIHVSWKEEAERRNNLQLRVETTKQQTRKARAAC